MTILITIFTILVAVGTGNEAIEWAAIAIIFLFLFVFGYAWQGCIWLYCAEIAPLEYRHIGAGFTAFGEWLMTFITVFAGPIAFENIGWSVSFLLHQIPAVVRQCGLLRCFRHHRCLFHVRDSADSHSSRL